MDKEIDEMFKTHIPYYIGINYVAAVPSDEAATTYTVLARGLMGEEMIHERMDLSKNQAERLARRVYDSGVVNVNHWTCRIPYGSDAWDSYGFEQALAYEERYCGLGD